MARTRLFKSGNGYAVLIPADMAYDDMIIELEVIRSGDVIMIFPARQNQGTRRPTAPHAETR